MTNQNQGQNAGNVRTGTQNRGFASMSDADQREIARMGGTAVSGNREHMAQIGRKGGEASAEARASIRNAARNAQDKQPLAIEKAVKPENRARDAGGSGQGTDAGDDAG